MGMEIVKWLLSIFLILFMGSGISFAQSRKDVPEEEKLYQLGLFFYNNDDISDKAAGYFQQVTEKFPNSQQASNAQFYLARYYTRKFYVYREQKGEAETNFLSSAVRAYQEFLSVYADRSTSWLSDAHFYLGLVYLELGDTFSALNQFRAINDTTGKIDPDIYIDQLIPSRDPGDFIERPLDAVALASEAERIFQEYKGAPFTLANSGALRELKNWSKGDIYYQLKQR